MLVAVEEAVTEGLFEKDRGGARQHQIDIEPGIQHRLAIVHGDAGEAFQRQHTTRRASPIDLGHAIGGIALEVLGEFRRRGAFQPKVELHPAHGAKGLGYGQRLEAAQPGLAALDPFGDPEHQVEVAREGRLDAGPQHLDRNGLALGGNRVVDLGDGGGGDGFVLEGGEHDIDRLTQFARHHGPRKAARKGRQAVL